MRGKDLVRRASACRFIRAFSACHLDMIGASGYDAMMHQSRKIVPVVKLSWRREKAGQSGTICRSAFLPLIFLHYLSHSLAFVYQPCVLTEQATCINVPEGVVRRRALSECGGKVRANGPALLKVGVIDQPMGGVHE